MKKHQKVLLGLMALGLAGGVGTTFALTRTAATSSVDGNGTDTAIYVEWGGATTDYADVKDLKAQEPQYRFVCVTSNSSKALKGTFNLTFTLNVGTKTEDTANATYALTGLTVDVYEVTTYGTSSFGDTDTDTYTKVGTLTTATEEGKTNTCTASTTFDGNATSKEEKTKNYTLVFTWDGTPVGKDETFGGYLAISQSFTE